jgi:ABC-type transporter Mla MlaB component
VGNDELWSMLFDLLRARGDWNRYRDLSARFTATFAAAAPQWLNEEDMARLPVELRPGAPGYFEFAGALDDARCAEMGRVRQAARKLTSVHLDVSRLSALGESGCAAFAELLRFLLGSGNGVLFTGTNDVAELYVYDAIKGERLKTFELPAPSASQAAIVGNTAIVGYGIISNVGGVRAYRLP